MLLGSLPYIRMVQMANGQPGALWQDAQARAYLLWIACAVAAVTAGCHASIPIEISVVDKATNQPLPATEVRFVPMTMLDLSCPWGDLQTTDSEGKVTVSVSSFNVFHVTALCAGYEFLSGEVYDVGLGRQMSVERGDIKIIRQPGEYNRPPARLLLELTRARNHTPGPGE